MKETKNKEDVLIGPQAAVQRYLDDLLQEATSESVVSEEQVSEEKASEENESEQAEAEFTLDQEEVESFSEELDATEPSIDDEALSDDEPLEETDPSAELSDTDWSSIDASFKDFENAVAEHVESLPEVEEMAQSVEPEPEPEPANLLATPEPVEKETEAQQAESMPEEIETPSVRVAKTDPLPWAKGRFECLLFYVGGLKMAVPLVELGGIFQSGEEKITSIFGQPDWFIGVANVGDFNLRTVDTARWVMPNHYQGDLKENFKFVIQLDRSNWGVACEKVAEAITLEPSQVKWRSDRSKRPWLAGTVIDHMCAILDVQGFIELLDDPKNGFKGPSK